MKNNSILKGFNEKGGEMDTLYHFYLNKSNVIALHWFYDTEEFLLFYDRRNGIISIDFEIDTTKYILRGLKTPRNMNLDQLIGFYQQNLSFKFIKDNYDLILNG